MINKVIVSHLLLCFIFADVQADEAGNNVQEMQIQVQAQKNHKVHVGVLLVGHQDHDIAVFAQRLKKDFEWSGQVVVTESHVSELKSEKDLKSIFNSEVSIVLIVSKTDRLFCWRLYDLLSMHMIVGKKQEQGNLSAIMMAHVVADDIWPQLFGQQSSFRSKIAYSKQIWKKKHGRERPFKQIWIADFDGTSAKLFINAPTVSFASRWSKDSHCPLLFYSENTISNVQLVMSNMFGNTKVVCSFDGLNMQPTFSKDAKRVVFCLSKDGTSQLYLSYIDVVTKKRKFDRLTFNSGDNLAPCFIDDHHVVFVSDYKTGKPQLFMLDLKTKYVTQVTDGGYCACPCYSFVRNQLVYSKMMGAVMQLFIYDFATQQHTQLTFDKGSKEEGSWSACGNYIVFGLNEGMHSRIAQLHLPTKKIRYITDLHEHCTYPDCSPIYQDFIGILGK